MVDRSVPSPFKLLHQKQIANCSAEFLIQLVHLTQQIPIVQSRPVQIKFKYSKEKRLK